MGRRAARRSPGLTFAQRLRRRLLPPLPLVVCIDVEPDARQVDPDDPSWRGFERLLDRVDELRARIAELAEGPTALAWFVRADPQIAELHGDAGWALRRYADELAELRAAGDEIGIHAHAWRRADGGGWLADHGDPEWVERCVLTAIESYREAFGGSPRSSRAGDRFLSDAVIELLDRNGVAADLTIEPRMLGAASMVDGERATGALPDYSAAPETIYRPSAEDFRLPGDGERELAMIPLTSGGPELLYPWMDRDTFWNRLSQRLGVGAGTHLAFALRSDIALVADHWVRALDNLAHVPHLAGVVAHRRVRTTTPAELARAVR